MRFVNSNIKISKAYSYSLHPISSKLYDKCVGNEEIYATGFLAICQNGTFYGTSCTSCTFMYIKNFVNIGQYGASNFKTLLLRFHLISTKLRKDIAYLRGVQAVISLGNRPH